MSGNTLGIVPLDIIEVIIVLVALALVFFIGRFLFYAYRGVVPRRGEQRNGPRRDRPEDLS